MGYVSLYRKWRPQTFEEVVGQDHITRTLKNAVKEDRVSHAYLFAGPRGTGKTSVAKILAKALNCEKGPTSTPCNKCHFCQAITAGSSIDVVEIDAASNRGIDEIRDLREKVRFIPTEAGVKVYIIDEVHMLTTEAFNALLKMLEEPPPHVVFVLATTEPYKVLPTILSRCQRFDFHRISTTELINRLKKVAQSEKITIDQASLSLIARHAHGSMRDAISTLDQLAAFTGKKVKLSDVTALLGMVESDLLFSMADVIGKKDTTKALQLVEKIADSGRDLRQFVKDLTEHFREIFIIHNADDPQGIINTTAEEFKHLEEQAKSFEPEWVISAVTVLSGVLNEMRYSSDPRLLLEVALVKMAKTPEEGLVETLAQRVAELEKRMSETGPAAAHPQKPSSARTGTAGVFGGPPAASPVSKKSTKPPTTNHQPPTTEGGVEAEKLKRAWEIVLKKVREKKISTYALILECEPVDMSGNIVTLQFDSGAGFHKKEVEKGDNRTLIEETFAEVLGLPLKVKCAISQTEPVEENAEKEELPPDKPDVVETLKESFGAKVLEEKEEK